MKGIITLNNGEKIVVDGTTQYFQMEEKFGGGVKVYQKDGKVEFFYPFSSILRVETDH